MVTIDQQEAITKKVLARVKQLQGSLVDKYFNAVTPWLIRMVLECAEQVVAPDSEGWCECDSIEIIRTHEGNVCAECGKLRCP